MDKTGGDYLTGLYTRQQLYELYLSLEKNCKFHFMFLDLDNFKNVNDVYGHNTGDALLIAVANILKDTAPTSKAIRLGGDEFALLFLGDYTKSELSSIAESIIYKVSCREGFEQIYTAISASIGILYGEYSGEPLDDILSKSDIAMYYAKSHGKSRYIFYCDIEQSILDRKEMEKRQQAALDSGEFEIRYLPFISPQTSRLMISCAQLYWNMPDGTTKYQSDFLPLFEQNGFVRELDLWTIRHVCGHLVHYHEHHGLSGKVSIRISKLLLLEENFPQKLRDYVTSRGITPDELNIGLSEKAFDRGSSNIILTLQELKEMGFGVSILDVGSDFKSLKYWDALLIDSLIFSSRYIQHSLKTSRGRQIIKMLLVIGRELKMQVMCNGIIEEEDAAFLDRCGCNALSGPYVTEPLPQKRYYEFVKNGISSGETKYEFHFKQNLLSDDSSVSGKLIGSGITYTEGVNHNWDGLYFPGGGIRQNVVELPSSLLADPSFTVCMWIYPLEANFWTSIFYARYRSCFTSFSPLAAESSSIFRVRDDTDVCGWHDAYARQIPCNTWSFICLTYDDVASTIRSYLNGRKTGYLANIPSLMACRQILLGGDPFQLSYKGCLSGLIFYNHVKTEAEIADIYNTFCQEPGFAGVREDFWMEDDN